MHVVKVVDNINNVGVEKNEAEFNGHEVRQEEDFKLERRVGDYGLQIESNSDRPKEYVI